MKFKIGEEVYINDTGYSRGIILSSLDNADGTYLVNIGGATSHNFRAQYIRYAPSLKFHSDRSLFGQVCWIGEYQMEHLKVKDTKIARLMHKDNIEKIEGGYIWLNSK